MFGLLYVVSPQFLKLFTIAFHLKPVIGLLFVVFKVVDNRRGDTEIDSPSLLGERAQKEKKRIMYYKITDA